MIRFFDYFNDSFRFALYSLKYKMYESEDEKHNLLIKDEIKAEKTEENLVLYYTRLVNITPETDPVIEVVYKIVFDYEAGIDHSKLTNDEILEALYDNALDELNQIAARMSLNIAQTTFSGFNQPMVLPPAVIRPDEG